MSTAGDWSELTVKQRKAFLLKLRNSKDKASCNVGTGYSHVCVSIPISRNLNKHTYIFIQNFIIIDGYI